MYIVCYYKANLFSFCISFIITFANMNKEKQIIIRVTEKEKEGFERASDIAGISLSAWARQKLRTSAIAELQNVGETAPFLKPIKIN